MAFLSIFTRAPGGAERRGESWPSCGSGRRRFSFCEILFDLVDGGGGRGGCELGGRLRQHDDRNRFFMTNVSASVGSVTKPAGLDKSQGIITGGYLIVHNYPPRWSGAPSHDPLGNRSDAKSSHGCWFTGLLRRQAEARGFPRSVKDDAISERLQVPLTVSQCCMPDDQCQNGL